jgi:hypothetical protein
MSGEVEFLDGGPDAGNDEELPQPDRADERARLRRLRINLLIGAVILGGAMLLARAATHSGPTATPTPTPSQYVPLGGYGTGAPDSGSGLLNGAASDAVGAPPPPPFPVRTSSDPGACPVHHTCRSTAGVAEQVRDAIRQAFPSATAVSGRTVRLSDSTYAGLFWYRIVHARVGSGELIVEVEKPPAARLTPLGPERPRGGVSYRAPQDGYVVAVEVRPGADARALQRLAYDPRLLVG